MCACRHKASHLGKACDAPVEDVCTSLGNSSKWLIQRGLGKPASVDDLLRVLDRTERLGLVHMGDNVLKKPSMICHCCGCCCGLLRAINETGIMSVHPSNFIPSLDAELCAGCGECAGGCHIRAITMAESGNGAETPVVKEDLCIGCGVCAAKCPTGALTMSRRSTLYVPPPNKMAQFMQIAMEKGRA